MWHPVNARVPTWDLVVLFGYVWLCLVMVGYVWLLLLQHLEKINTQE
jgi:hypothetical protein